MDDHTQILVCKCGGPVRFANCTSKSEATRPWTVRHVRCATESSTRCALKGSSRPNWFRRWSGTSAQRPQLEGSGTSAKWAPINSRS
jgi:hypothetical protein